MPDVEWIPAPLWKITSREGEVLTLTSESGHVMTYGESDCRTNGLGTLFIKKGSKYLSLLRAPDTEGMMLYAAYRQFDGGARSVLVDSLDSTTEEQAQKHIDNILGPQRKPHKLDFFIVDYTAKTRAEVFKRERIEI